MKTIAASMLAFAAVISAQSTNAPVVNNNPNGAMYLATFANSITNVIRGRVVASSPFGGSVNYAINIANLPQGAAPFEYHIHEFPVPSNGDCMGTGLHLDPFNRGEQPPCDASQPQTCQLGDLSGKHGKINGTAIATTYNDVYTSTTIGSSQFIGNRSIVVHASNGTRIACASFVTYLTGTNSTGFGSGASGNSSSSGGGSGGNLTFSAAPTASATNIPPRPFPTASSTPIAANANAGVHGVAVSMGVGLVAVVGWAAALL